MNARSLSKLVLIVAALGAPAAAQAAPHGPVMKALLKKMPVAAASAAKKARKTRLKAGECPSFAGHWKGTCTDQYETSDDEVTIEQGDCDNITLYGQEFEFGGAINLGESDLDGYWSSVAGYTDWNATRTGFTLRVNGTDRTLGQDSYSTFQGKDEYSLLEGKLVTQSKTQYSAEEGGTIYNGDYWEECTYEKQADVR